VREVGSNPASGFDCSGPKWKARKKATRKGCLSSLERYTEGMMYQLQQHDGIEWVSTTEEKRYNSRVNAMMIMANTFNGVQALRLIDDDGKVHATSGTPDEIKVQTCNNGDYVQKVDENGIRLVIRSPHGDGLQITLGDHRAVYCVKVQTKWLLTALKLLKVTP
jgi:hypothetical protein